MNNQASIPDTHGPGVRADRTAVSPGRRIRFFAAAIGLAGLFSTAAGAQVCGDVNADGEVSVSDAQRVLRAAVDQPVELICSSDQCSALETRVEALEKLLEHVTIDGDNLVLTGMNFQVVSGTGDTDGKVNGTGNIIIGYDESNNDNDEKSGSHNLVIGRNHSYEGYAGIIAGEDNEQTGVIASVLGGTGNAVDGDGAVVVGGQDNQADGETTVILAGENNRALGRSCSISAGTSNLCTGGGSAISGGNQNNVSGTSATIGGGGQGTLNSSGAWLAGSFGPTF